MKRHKLVDSEALDWIQSLSFTGEQSFYHDSYLEGHAVLTSPHKGLTIEAYKRHLLKCGLSKWIKKYKFRSQKILSMLELEVNASLRLQEWKSRLCLMKWADYVSRQQLKLFTTRRTELKLSMGMYYRYKMRTCLHYWIQRVKDRRRKKSKLFSEWKHLLYGRTLVKLGFRIMRGMLLREGFTRWKRRSKWPLVATKRAMWVETKAISALSLYAHRRNRDRTQIRNGELLRLKQHFPRLVSRLIAQKRSKAVLHMGSDLYSLKHLTIALKKWRCMSVLQSKISQYLHQSFSNRRNEWIHKSIGVLKRHAQRAVRKEIHFRTAYLHHKRRMFRQFVRGVRIIQGQSMSVQDLTQADTIQNNTSRLDVHNVLVTPTNIAFGNNSSMTVRSTARGLKEQFSTPTYVLFRGRLYHKEHSLLKQWRSCTKKLVIQRDSRLWGTRWFKRVAFRTLQLNCRKRRNVTLSNCYASLQCKHRLLRLYTLYWFRRATLSKSLQLMSSYIYMRKYMRKWAKWCRVSQNSHWKTRRAELRWTVNQQQNALQWWYQNIHHQQHRRYGLKVFRKLHPVPSTSAVGRVFQAWRSEYLPQRKSEKKLFKQAVQLRKYASIKRTLQQWSDAFETSVVRKHNLLRACRVLYKLYSVGRSKIYKLSNALILRVHNPSFMSSRGYKLVSFLARHGLMVRTSLQLKHFYVLCFLRRFLYTWRRYSQKRQQQLISYHHTYTRAAYQCSHYFATYYHVLHKHMKWTQWRAIRAWYTLHNRRMLCFSGINTRIHLKHHFQRWVEMYNRKLINYHLRIPTPPIMTNSVRVGDIAHNAHNTTVHSNRTSMSSQFNDTFASRNSAMLPNTTANTSYTHNTTSTRTKKAMPVHTINDSIHLNPASARTIAHQRLQQLRSSQHGNHINISNISAISTASSAGSVSCPDNAPHIPRTTATKDHTITHSRSNNTPLCASAAARGYTPKCTSKLIDATQHTTLNNSSAILGASHRSFTSPSNANSTGIQKENKPSKNANHLFSENLNVSYSRLHENRIDPAQSPGAGFVFAPVADISGVHVSGKKAYGETLLRKSTDRSVHTSRKNKPLWGNVIEEDHVDAAKRSYMGQYLLGKTVL